MVLVRLVWKRWGGLGAASSNSLKQVHFDNLKAWPGKRKDPLDLARLGPIALSPAVDLGEQPLKIGGLQFLKGVECLRLTPTRYERLHRLIRLPTAARYLREHIWIEIPASISFPNDFKGSKRIWPDPKQRPPLAAL